MADMQELIARLEAAEAGSRELDREIMALTYSWEQRHIGVTCWDDREGRCCPGAKHMSWVWVDPATGQWKTNAKEGLEFTTSLDAALALAERVLPGKFWTVYAAYRIEGRMTYGVNLDDDSDTSYSKTPALALCVSILKAKAQGEGG